MERNPGPALLKAVGGIRLGPTKAEESLGWSSSPPDDEDPDPALLIWEEGLASR